jgi:lysophospholipase L1-like esterase
MNDVQKYLALGDSMSIDAYTGVAGGGAVSQFYRKLGDGWSLDDRTRDGCEMADVPRDVCGNLITLTIGGNDLIVNRDEYLGEGLARFADQHLELLSHLRERNPDSIIIVGDVYAPAGSLTPAEKQGLAAANLAIWENCQRIDAALAPIHSTFRGHEAEYLCMGIEPTLAGATAIAALFFRAHQDCHCQKQA